MIGIIQGSKAVQMRSETFKSRLGRLKTSCGNGNAICRAVKWKKVLIVLLHLSEVSAYHQMEEKHISHL